MIPVKIDLSDISDKKPRLRQLLFFAGLVFVGFIIASVLIMVLAHSRMEWIIVVAAVYLLLYIYYSYTAYNTELYIKVDDQCFEYKFGIRKRSKNRILWQVVTKLKIGPAYIAFYKKSGRRKLVELNWLTYSKVIEIKSMLTEVCKNQNIKTEIVEFIKYNDKKDQEK